MNSKSRLKKKMDGLWYAALHRRWKRCAKCNSSPVEIHHLVPKARLATAWLPENGLPLCSEHHRLSKVFSAHETKNEFLLWLKDKYPGKWAWYMANRERLEYSADLKEKLEQLKTWAL